MSILVQQSQTLCFGLTEPIVTQCIGDVVPPPKPANALTDRFIMTGDSLRRLHHTYRVTLDAQHPTRTAHILRSQSRTASTRDAPRARDVHPFLHARPRAQHAICGTMRRFNAFRAVVPQQCAPTTETNAFSPHRGNTPVLKTAETSHSWLMGEIDHTQPCGTIHEKRAIPHIVPRLLVHNTPKRAF